eukprot:gene3390-1986_t
MLSICEDHQCRLFKAPPRSPDLNPVENAISVTKSKAWYAIRHLIRNRHKDLDQGLEWAEWWFNNTASGAECTKNLVRSMYEERNGGRMQACFDADGGYF